MSDHHFPSDGRCKEDKASTTNNIISVKLTHKWDVYHRLKALEIDCQCKTNQPLLIELNTPQTAIQVWSVVKHLTAPRQELIDWLNRCWQSK